MEPEQPRKRRSERAPANEERIRRPEPSRESEHDQDSEPPRTARAPGSDAIEEEWGRQEGC